MQQSSTSSKHLKSKAHVVRVCLTLSANYYERYLRNRPVGSELVVDLVNFLEAGLIFQTEDQDNCIHPTSKLERGEEEKRSRLTVRTK